MSHYHSGSHFIHSCVYVYYFVTNNSIVHVLFCVNICWYVYLFQSVTLHTELGDIKLELFCDYIPKTCEAST